MIVQQVKACCMIALVHEINKEGKVVT